MVKSEHNLIFDLSFEIMSYTVIDNTIEFRSTTTITEDVETSVGIVKFENCRISSGVKIQFRWGIKLTNCTIGRSCFIRRDLKDCEYANDDVLIIRNNQEMIEFNSVYIHANNCNDAIVGLSGSESIVIVGTKNFLEICGDDHAIEARGSIYIRTVSDLIIKSSGSAISVNDDSYLELTIDSKKNEFNLQNKGFEIFGSTKIQITDTRFFVETHNQRTSINFSEKPFNWSDKRIMNTEPIKGFKLIDINLITKETVFKDEFKIELSDNEYQYPLVIKGRKISNPTDRQQSVIPKSIRGFKGDLIIGSNSSIETDSLFILPSDSVLTVEKDAKINHSIINCSNVILRSELKDTIIWESVAEFNEPVIGKVFRQQVI